MWSEIFAEVKSIGKGILCHKPNNRFQIIGRNSDKLQTACGQVGVDVGPAPLHLSGKPYGSFPENFFGQFDTKIEELSKPELPHADDLHAFGAGIDHPAGKLLGFYVINFKIVKQLSSF